MTYPDFSKEFDIDTDILSKQLGAAVTQGSRPIGFFSRKLHHNVTKIELLAIVETLKEFQGIL